MNQEHQVFFTNRWKHPVNRWRNRLLPVVSCGFLCFFTVFFALSGLTAWQKKTAVLESLLLNSLICTLSAIAIVYIHYYVKLRVLAQFKPVKVRLERLRHND